MKHRKKGHRPLKVLEHFHRKMQRNLDKLGKLIVQRRKAGQR